MVKEKVIMLFLVFSLLVVSSCEENTSTGVGISPKVLDFEFEGGFPPEELSEDEDFQVGLTVFNELTKKVNFDLCIKGDRSDYYGGVPVARDCISQTVDEAYEGSGGSIIPSEKIIYFPSETTTYAYYNLEEGVGDVNLYAELEYGIDSLSSVDVCILGSPNLDENIDCSANEILENSKIQQVAYPLVVSKIEKNIKKVAGNTRIDLKIHLDKASSGEIVKEKDSQFYLIDVSAYLSGTEAEFFCREREGKVVFQEGDPIECTADLNLEDDSIIYKDSLNINLGYKYKSVKSKKIMFNTDDWWGDQ